jgi:hypothetical protein
MGQCDLVRGGRGSLRLLRLDGPCAAERRLQLVAENHQAVPPGLTQLLEANSGKD